MHYIIFGAGNSSKELISKMRSMGLEISYLVDNNSNKQGSFLCGLEIKPVTALLTDRPEHSHILVASAIKSNYSAMVSQLKRMGFRKNIDFSNGLLDFGISRSSGPQATPKTRFQNYFSSISHRAKPGELYPIPKPVNVPQILEDKVALIVGGSGGIGLEIARSFLNSGAKVVLCGTSQNKLDVCCRNLNSPNVKSMVLDLKNVSAFSRHIEAAAALFPENRIDILVNSAGIEIFYDFLDVTEEGYDAMMDINAKGLFFMTQAMGRYMIHHQIKGHILNLSSSSALRPAYNPYNLSKHLVKDLTLGMADALLPYGIIVNAIAPGPVATPMLGKYHGQSIAMPEQPSGRYAMPSEIAALAAFMVSDFGNLIVGETYYMTGGSGNLDLKY